MVGNQKWAVLHIRICSHGAIFQSQKVYLLPSFTKFPDFMEERRPPTGSVGKMMINLVDSFQAPGTKKCSSVDLQKLLEKCNQKGQKLVESHVSLIDGFTDWCEELPGGDGRHLIRKFISILESVAYSCHTMEFKFNSIISHLSAVKIREERHSELQKINSQLHQKLKAVSCKYGKDSYKTAVFADRLEDNRYSLKLIERQTRKAIETDVADSIHEYFDWMSECVEQIRSKLDSNAKNFRSPEDDLVPLENAYDLADLEGLSSKQDGCWNSNICTIPNLFLEFPNRKDWDIHEDPENHPKEVPEEPLKEPNMRNPERVPELEIPENPDKNSENAEYPENSENAENPEYPEYPQEEKSSNSPNLSGPKSVRAKFANLIHSGRDRLSQILANRLNKEGSSGDKHTLLGNPESRKQDRSKIKNLLQDDLIEFSTISTDENKIFDAPTKSQEEPTPESDQSPEKLYSEKQPQSTLLSPFNINPVFTLKEDPLQAKW